MILIVDDAPANIDVLLAVIGELDDIAVALDGEEALEIVKEEKPDIILLDIVMPGLNGFEVCEILKSSDTTRNIPVIFLSGNDSQDEKEQALALGAVDYLTKPVDPDLLLEIINKNRS